MGSRVTDLLEEIKDSHEISDQEYLYFTALTRISNSHVKVQNSQGKVTS